MFMTDNECCFCQQHSHTGPDKNTDTLELNKHNFQHVTAIRSLSLSI